MPRPRKAPKKFVRQLAEEFYGDYGERARSWEFIDDLFRLEEGDIFEDYRTGRVYRVDPDDLMDALEALPRKSRLARILHEEGLIKTAGQDPISVSKEDIRNGDAFMTYLVDEGNNNSKFYEVSIRPQRDGTWSYIPRWGALTDTGRPGRIDGDRFDKHGLTEDQARRMLDKQYKKRIQRGYTDAARHKSFAKFQYPVGLSRRPGFGWGVQSITTCVPELRGMVELIDMSLAEVREDDPIELLGHLESMTEILRGLEDSDMAERVSKLIRPAIERMRKNPRFILEPARTVKDLQKVRRYLNKQLALCNV